MPEKTVNDLTRDLRVLYTKGGEAMQRENFDYAIALFTQVLEKEPHFFECRKVLRAAQAAKSGGGGGFFKRFTSGASSAPQLAKGQMALRKNPLEAIQIAEQVLATDANNGGAHRLLAEAALAAEMPREAVMSLEILFKASPKDKELAMRLAEALAASGEQSRGERILEDLRREYPRDNEIFMALKNLSARKTMDEGGYTKLASGEGSYRDILKDKAESVSIEQEKRQVKSEDVTERLIREKEARLKTEPGNLKTLRDLGDLYLQKNEFDRALDYYQKIMAVDGGADSSLQRHVADVRVKKFNLALAQLDPTAPDHAERAAAIKAERQAFQLEECKQRAERYPTDLQIRFELGQHYFEAGKISESVLEFQKAQGNPHRRIAAMTYLAKCFEKRGMNDMAARKLQETLKEKPGFDDEKKELVYTLANVFEKMGKKTESIEQLKLIYDVDAGYKDVGQRVEDYYAGGGT